MNVKYNEKCGKTLSWRYGSGTQLQYSWHDGTDWLSTAVCNKPQHRGTKMKSLFPNKNMKIWDLHEGHLRDRCAPSGLQFSLGDGELGENKGVLKSCQGLNLAWLCSSLVMLVIEDSAPRGFLWFSVSERLVVLPGRQNHRGFLKQHKRKNTFREHSVKLHNTVYNTQGTHKTSNSQTISYQLSVCHY